MFKGLFFNQCGKGPTVRSPGAHRIASWLRMNDWDIEVLDFLPFWSIEELKEFCVSRIDHQTKFVAFSYMFFTPQVNNFPVEFLIWIKEQYPQLKIIVGSQEKYLHGHEHVDYIISGYGEFAILELLRYLFSNGDRPKFALENPFFKFINANKLYPAYPMKNLSILYENRDYLSADEWLGIEFSRGCMFKCDFCNYPILGVKGDYTRDADDFRNQVTDTYERFGVSNYVVADETFNDRTEKITKFADVVETLDFSPFFQGFLRADLLVSRPTDREELLRMNFLAQFYGIETFNHQSGKAIKKAMHPDKLKDGLIDIKKYFHTHGSKKYRGFISLIFGLPYETVESLNTTKNWLIDNWQGESFGGSPLEIRLSSENSSLISDNYEKYGYRKMIDDKNFPGLIWENEFMNIMQARQISQDFQNLYNNKQYDFRVYAHWLPDTQNIDLFKNQVDVADRLRILDRITLYKNKKLSTN